jgi:hypothetical protein
VRSDDLYDFVLAPGLLQVGCRGEMPRFAIALRERLVGDAAKQVLQEPVLTVLG